MGVFAAAFALFSVSCGRRDGDVSGHPAAPTESTEATAHRESALATLRTAEYSRASAAVSDDLLADHDVAVRRAAARALARILDPRAVERLGAKLADEDDEVVAWTAYGIGEACPLGDTHTVRALAARLTSLEPSAETGRPGHPSAMPALLDALSRCGSTPAEATLRAWLEGAPEARSAAALSLARLAARQHHLDDASVVALLDAANASPPVHGALAAFGQLESIPDIAGKRLVQVAEHSIRDAGRERTFAISALLPSGGAGVELLAAVLTDEKLPPAPRTRAAATLGRMGKVAGPALGTAIEVLVPAGTVADARWLDVHFAPVLAALTSLDPPAAGATDALGRVSDLSLPDGAPPSVVRRLVALRCAAGAVLAGSATLSTRLVHCDPDPNGRAGALATLRVLDRGKLSGPRRKVWATYLGSPVPGVRRAALALLPRHLEAAPVVIELANALGAKEPGVVAQAARDLADAPRLAVAHADVAHTDVAAHTATDGAGTPATSAEPSRAIVDALAHAMDAERPPDQVETRIALASAAAGVGALSLKPRLERYCASDSPALRRAAESALRALGANGTSCDAPKTTPAASIAIPAFPTKPVTLVFATDAGRFAMTLDPSFAPAAVARITELARKGFYDGMPILRVSPGYIVQLGDSTGDGSGGAGLPPVPSEGTPVEFGAFAVGLALGGKDTGSSQLFVTASEEPPLFGDYPLLGSADPEWATVAEGDTILHVEVRDGTASHTN
jgi:cyclophilin family peptidyl-prolyl cis-trans isomerase/HEAT repeat protein